MDRIYKTTTAASAMVIAALMMSGCQADEITSPDDINDSMHIYHISAGVTNTQEDGREKSPQRRAMSEDAQSLLHSEWASEDELMAYCLRDNDKSREKDYSLLANTSTGKSGGFDGEIKTVNEITTTDELCFFYPGSASKGNGKTIFAAMGFKDKGTEIEEDENGKEKKRTFEYVYHERQETIKHLVDLDLTRQDGTAETIGRKFDFQWAKASPETVNEAEVNVNVGKMQRQIAIWGLRFASKDGRILTDIDSIYISNMTSVDVFDLGTGRFVEENTYDEAENIVIKPASGKLTSANGKYTYVALFPGNYSDVLITAYVGGKCYARTYNAIDIEADRVYRTDVLQMEEVNPKPYVEVQGVKWATGNFIHYQDPGDASKEYWGIAPAQWWISQRYIPGEEIPGWWPTSQFKNKNRESVTNDLDLFRYGDIENALNLKAGYYKAGTGIDIAKNFYESTGTHKTTTRDKAFCGDIVWYYTMYKNQKYRMPNRDEMRRLFKEANVIPGYCYSDNGLPIYGAYFYTNNGEKRKKTFPTRPNKYYKYTNVTALVRVGKGLFLPITGRRVVLNKDIGFRDMTYFGGAYGQYMTSKSTTADLSVDGFFGTTEWNFSANGKGQAKAIRPVWDESSTTLPDPVFEPFKDIR